MVTKSKTTERRHKLRLQLIEAAEAAVAANGLKSLTARDLAKQVGCSVGAIYNVFEDIDELIIAVNSRTLARLDRSIAAFEPASGMGAQQCLVALAQTYCRFATANTNLWTALFEHGERINRDIPDWHLDEHVQLIRHIVKSMEKLYPARSQDELWQLAGLMFSAVHGVVSLGLQGFFFAVPPEALEKQVAMLVNASLEGLKAG
jgi:AcrR family transcriptional regulator